MRSILPAVLVLFAGSVVAQSGELLTLTGALELVDKPPEATPVEAMDVMIRQLPGGRQFRGHPDHDGSFALTVPPGRYSLNLPFPGRIQVFTCGSRSLHPDDFQLEPADRGPLRIVVSLKTAGIVVEITGAPENRHKEAVALLSPADPYLTLRDSGLMNKFTGDRTRFRFVPPGSYTLLIVDSEFQNAVAFSSAVRDRLKDRATFVQAPDRGETAVTAIYIPAEEVERAIQRAGTNR